VRRIKSTVYIPLIPTYSLKGEGAGTCVDTHALGEGWDEGIKLEKCFILIPSFEPSRGGRRYFSLT
jgi:hypothetical protein